MAASNSKGVTIRMLRSSASGISITPTGASKADPSVIAAAALMTTANGDIASLAADSTGLKSIDGKAWPVGGIAGTGTPTSFTLLGSKAANDSGTFAAGTAITVYRPADFITLCLSQFSVNPGSTSTTSTATFCDPTSSVPSAVSEAGTVDIGGYIDITAADYQEMLAWDAASGSRLFDIVLPNNGDIIFHGTLASMNWDIPIDGALAWSATMTLDEKPRHLF
jgi:hypothetical protein